MQHQQPDQTIVWLNTLLLNFNVAHFIAYMQLAVI